MAKETCVGRTKDARLFITTTIHQHTAMLLAETWRNQTNYDKAILMFLSTLELAIKALGLEHMTSVRGHHNLGSSFVEIIYYIEAEKNLKILEATGHQIFGFNNQSTIRSQICLGQAYYKKSGYDEAFGLVGSGLDGLRKIHGLKNLFVHLAVENLADIWFEKKGSSSCLKIV